MWARAADSRRATPPFHLLLDSDWEGIRCRRSLVKKAIAIGADLALPGLTPTDFHC